MYSVSTREFPDGGIYGFNREMALCGWMDSKLAQKIPFEEFWRIQQSVQAEAHVKVIVECPKYGPMGGVILTQAIDAQVGDCLVAFHQFLKAPARGTHGLWRKVLRECLAETKRLGFKFLAWSHRDERTGRIYIKHMEV